MHFVNDHSDDSATAILLAEGIAPASANPTTSSSGTSQKRALTQPQTGFSEPKQLNPMNDTVSQISEDVIEITSDDGHDVKASTRAVPPDVSEPITASWIWPLY